MDINDENYSVTQIDPYIFVHDISEYDLYGEKTNETPKYEGELELK